MKDEDESKKARDEGIEQVSESNIDWMVDAHIRASKLKSWTGTGEDLRIRLTSDGLPPPAHPNAWGALVNYLVRKEILLPTNNFRHMRTKTSHARITRVYVAA